MFVVAKEQRIEIPTQVGLGARGAPLAVVLVVLLSTSAARAEITTTPRAGSGPTADLRRIAVLVAHPFGGDDLVPLRYTQNDVERVREVLETWAGFARRDVLVSFGEDADAVAGLLDEAGDRVDEAKARGQGSLLVFYYSGHAKDGALRLGESVLHLTELKRLIERTDAGLRVALLDSCRSGSITRLKGATKGEPIALSFEEPQAQQGQVLITASSESEDAQESDEIQGSFFTHFLTTGLRGAADDDGDGTVTLNEAYGFAYAHTVATTVGTKGGTQHPTYRWDLRGAGDLILSRPNTSTSGLVLGAAVEGHFVVFDLERRIVVAELDKSAGQPLRLGLGVGRYVVKKREVDHLRMSRVRLRKGEVEELDVGAMERVAFADDYAKGDVVTAEAVRAGPLGLRLSVVIGPQLFLSAPVRDAYVPPLGFVQARFDFANLVRRNLGLRLDVGIGASGERALRIDDPYVGRLDLQTSVLAVNAGLSGLGALPLLDWLALEASVRLGWILVSRSFSDASLVSQSFSTFLPGAGLELSARVGKVFRIGIGGRLHYMYFSGDEDVSVALFDGGLTLTMVLR